MKYAHLERERRFLLAGPPRMPSDGHLLTIRDRYSRGTRLRLRVVQEAGRQPVRKLGQKIRIEEGKPSTAAHTSIYLDEAEYAALLLLPADELTKTRTLSSADGRTWAVDSFAGPLAGLWLAETDLGEPADSPDPAPPFSAVAEVTDDERFTGATLAVTSTADLDALLAGPGTAPR